MLLIATNRRELAADYLILRLEDREVPFQRFNTETLGDRSEIDIACGPDSFAFLLTLEDNHELTAEEISGVYFHHAQLPLGPPGVKPEHGEFATRECLETLRSLWRLIPEERWLNYPARLWRAENKVEQLVVAHRCGLDIPDTLITRRRSRVESFMRKHRGNVVVKAVRHGFIIEEKGMKLAGTQRLAPEFPELMNEYAAVPAVFQEAIPSQADVRVVLVDSRIFAVEIRSSSEHVDWRLAELTGEKLNYERIDLPTPVGNACRGVLREFGLRYSSIDLIRSKDGRFLFLELNPSGQWAWLEQTTGCPIRDAIINGLDPNHG